MALEVVPVVGGLNVVLVSKEGGENIVELEIIGVVVVGVVGDVVMGLVVVGVVGVVSVVDDL